jgi:hypothetical protein
MLGMTHMSSSDHGCGSSPTNEKIADYEDSIEFAKFRARIILNSTNRKIIIPSREEMIGLYALERDDQLKRNNS